MKEQSQTNISLVNRLLRSDRLYENTTRLVNENINKQNYDNFDSTNLLEES